MIAYTILGTNDFERATAFYDELLAEFGAKRKIATHNGQYYGFPNGPMFGIATPHDGQPATNGNGTMIALKAKSNQDVDRIFARALDLGATDDGAPGPRKIDGFYGGYFRDFDNNKLCVFYMD